MNNIIKVIVIAQYAEYYDEINYLVNPWVIIPQGLLTLFEPVL